ICPPWSPPPTPSDMSALSKEGDHHVQHIPLVYGHETAAQRYIATRIQAAQLGSCECDQSSNSLSKH
uniref:Uncharacterized protein n=1 Tax=Fundulus heteroclitus TaxID=8078 RepID=A0A3Q2NW23_FUNHE